MTSFHTLLICHNQIALSNVIAAQILVIGNVLFIYLERMKFVLHKSDRR